MTIHVTQLDIDKGLKKAHIHRACRCPIALAFKHSGYLDAAVGCSDVSLKPGSKLIRLPSKAVSFIASFDAKQPVAPFSFRLALS